MRREKRETGSRAINVPFYYALHNSLTSVMPLSSPSNRFSRPDEEEETRGTSSRSSESPDRLPFFFLILLLARDDLEGTTNQPLGLRENFSFILGAGPGALLVSRKGRIGSELPVL